MDLSQEIVSFIKKTRKELVAIGEILSRSTTVLPLDDVVEAATKSAPTACGAPLPPYHQVTFPALVSAWVLVGWKRDLVCPV